MANNNSIYVQSLVDFLLDTKPYHSKLTEIIEEYRFADELTVNFDERLLANNMMKAAWPYTYFSGGVPSGQVTRMHQLVAPNVRTGTFAVGSENTDLPSVPYAYDPKSIHGIGLVNAMFRRANGVEEPITEAHDIHLSHGAYTFQIHQTNSTQTIVLGRFFNTYDVTDGPFPFTVTLPFSGADSLVIVGPAEQVDLETVSITGPGEVSVYGVSAGSPYAPLFVETRHDGLLSHATAIAQLQALDLSNPSSAINRLQVLLNAISAQLLLFPNAAASLALADIQDIVDSVNLPSSYEGLLNALISGGTPVIPGYIGWKVDLGAWPPPYQTYVDQAFAALSTGLYFNAHTDLALRENGALRYNEVYRDDIEITNIVPNTDRPDYEEWELEAITSTTLFVRGSISGIIGSISVPGSFAASQISFDVAAGVDTLVIGTKIKLTPASKITVHTDAPLENWSLIKVNPKSFTRPLFTSTRYGYLISSTAQRDYITVLDAAIPSGTIVLTAVSATQFVLTSTAEPGYTAVITVGVPFNDGRLAFTVVQGSSYQFQIGDKFYVELVNPPPSAADLDLQYGFDMDPYDAENMVYNNVSALLNDYLSELDFGWASRFTSYDLSSFNLQISQDAQPGRQWRLRALRDLSDPQYELKLQNSVPPNMVSSIAVNDPTNPAALTQFDMLSNTSEGVQTEIDADSTTDLLLWYANSFELEFFDTGTSTWVAVATIPVGSSYSSTTHGLAFTLVPGSKPFIAAQLNSTQYDSLSTFSSETVFGGDVISWTVLNDAPNQTEPAGLTSKNATHMWIHADSFHNSTPAMWTLTWINSSQYYLQGVYTSGSLNGQFIYAAPGLLVDTAQGMSYRNDVHGLHWTLYPGSIGCAAGESISLRILETRPTYLVHGSVSGWEQDATVGDWYWNGKIGFKIMEPTASLFENGVKLDSWTTSAGLFTLQSLRIDSPSAAYTIRSHTNGHWTMYRDGKVVADGDTVLRDEYVSLLAPTATAGTIIVLNIVADDHQLALGNDLAIVRSSAGRSLKSGDSVVIQRGEFDALQISIKPKDSAHNLALQPLGITTTDLRFVDHNTLSGSPLQSTSPETAVLQGWIPILESRFDSSSSEAVFSDAQTKVSVRAAGTGETIGVIESFDSGNPAEPVLMRWDSAFAAAYLPLNAEATLVSLGAGLNDVVKTNITEGIIFLLSGGGLSDNALFTDEISVSVLENPQFRIATGYAESTDIVVADGPFVGFLPGFDNAPYDFELGGDLDVGEDNDPEGFYDAGQALTGDFWRAKYLSDLIVTEPHPVLTVDEQLELDALISKIGPYLQGSLTTTSLEQFINAINADAAVCSTPVAEFGVPAVGAGIDVQQSNVNSTAASVAEAITFLSVDSGTPYDEHGYDFGEYDRLTDNTAIVLVNNAFPLSVEAVSVVDHPLTGLVVDGSTVPSASLVLITNQASPSQNGIYVADVGTWTRASHALVTDLKVQVLSGVTNGGTVWSLTTAPTILNTDPVVFTEITAYEDFDTALSAIQPGGRVIDLSLTFNYAGTPRVWVWKPGVSPAPALIETIAARRFRLSTPAQSEFKLIAG